MASNDSKGHYTTSSSNISTTQQESTPVPRSPSRQTFTLLLFASASTYANDTDSLTLPAPSSLRTIVTHLEQAYPGMTDTVLRQSAWSVNLNYVEFEIDSDGDVEVSLGDEVAVIPPVSSG